MNIDVPSHRSLQLSSVSEEVNFPTHITFCVSFLLSYQPKKDRTFCSARNIDKPSDPDESGTFPLINFPNFFVENVFF